MRREDRQSLLVGGDDHDHHPRALLRAVALVEGERRLVAVVAVGDQQLRVGELRGERVAELGVEAPEPRGHAALLRREVGLAEPVERDRAVPEQEDRLELRARRLEQPQAALLRAGVRALVRQDHAVLVRLDAERGDEALARARDAVGADVLLREPPVRRLLAPRRARPSRASPPDRRPPAPPSPAASGGRRCAGCGAGTPCAPPAEMTSYGGATRSGERPGDRFVVAERAKGADRRHRL